MKPAQVRQRVERNIWGVRRVERLAANSTKWSGAIESDRSDRLAAFA